LLASTFSPVSESLPGLGRLSALGLFALTLIVSPSNIFMATHNAPGPGPKVITPSTQKYFMKCWNDGIMSSWSELNALRIHESSFAMTWLRHNPFCRVRCYPHRDMQSGPLPRLFYWWSFGGCRKRLIDGHLNAPCPCSNVHTDNQSSAGCLYFYTYHTSACPCSFPSSLDSLRGGSHTGI